MTENRCICCGSVIPEGRQVCPACEKDDEHIAWEANGKRDENE